VIFYLYYIYLISDLSRIKNSRRVNGFCFDLSRYENNPIIREENKSYLERLEYYYGKIDSLTRKYMSALELFREYVLHNTDALEELLKYRNNANFY